jgi:hypothetical protein
MNGMLLNNLPGANPELGMKNAPTQIAMIIKILKSQNLIEINIYQSKIFD